MRILIIAPFLPKPDAGHAGGVVLWRMIQELSLRYELHLIAFARTKKEQSSTSLRGYCASLETVLKSNISVSSDFRLKPFRRARNFLFSRLPYGVWRLRSSEMFELIKRKVQEMAFDIVQIEFASMGQYIDAVDGYPNTIFREHDLTYVHYARRVRTTDVLWRKLYHLIQWRRMRRYEIQTAQCFQKVIVPSQVAKNELIKYLPERKIEVIPFGITLPDISSISFKYSSKGKNLLFVGAMGRPYNVEAVMYFYEEIWPLIFAEEPNVRFWIVGSQPPAHIRQLAELDDRIEVTGFVEDLTPYYLKADVFVAPLTIGGGVVTKILDAMAMGKPVVTTTIGNEGIGAQDGRDLVIADAPQAFAREVLSLLAMPERRRKLGMNGGDFVRSRFSWSQIAGRFEEVYHEIVETRA